MLGSCLPQTNLHVEGTLRLQGVYAWHVLCLRHSSSAGRLVMGEVFAPSQAEDIFGLLLENRIFGAF